MVKVDYSSLQTMSQSTETSCNDLNTKIQQIMNPLNSIISDGEISGAGPDAIKAFATSTVIPMLLAQGQMVMATSSAVKNLESKYSGNVDSKSWEDTELQEIIDKLQTQIDKIEEKLKKKQPNNKSGLKQTLEALKEKKKFYEDLLDRFLTFCNECLENIPGVAAMQGISAVISGYKGGSGKNSFKDDPGKWASDTLTAFIKIGSDVGNFLDVIDESARWQMFCKIMSKSDYKKWKKDYDIWKKEYYSLEIKDFNNHIKKLPSNIKEILKDSKLNKIEKIEKILNISKHNKKYEKYIDFFEHKNDIHINKLKKDIHELEQKNKSQESLKQKKQKKLNNAKSSKKKNRYKNQIKEHNKKIKDNNKKISKKQKEITNKSKQRKNIHKKVDKFMNSKPIKVVKNVGKAMSIIDTGMNVTKEVKEGDSLIKAAGDVAVAKGAGFVAGKVAGAVFGAIPVVGPVTGVIADAVVSNYVESKVEESI